MAMPGYSESMRCVFNLSVIFNVTLLIQASINVQTNLHIQNSEGWLFSHICVYIYTQMDTYICSSITRL